MTPEQIEKLGQFLGGHFHEDWAVDADAPDQVVTRFLSEGHPRHALVELADLVEVYAETADDDQMLERMLFRQLGCYYMPSADGIGAGAWLQHVATLLRAST